jgi:hypothetical protein
MLADPAEPQYVRDLLQAGREFQVQDYDFGKGLEKHLGVVAAGAPIVTASLVGAVLYATREPEPAQKVPAPVVAPVENVPAATPSQSARAIEPAETAAEPAQAARPKLAADSARAARRVASSSASDDLFATARPAAPSERAETAPQPAERADEQAPARPEPAKRAEPVLDDSRLEREMGMLAVAQRVLHSDPARALSLARQGEAEFGGSMFTQERQQLLLLSLVKLGRMDEARRLAKPYLARYPNGPFSDRVRRALATGRVER